jgi:glutamate synthase domain-containing protein 2
MPVLFSAMSYGSISYNAHKSLALAASELGTFYNTGEGGLHEDFYCYGANTIVQVASGRFGVHEDYLKAGRAIEIKMGQGAKPGIGGHLPGTKIVGGSIRNAADVVKAVALGADACYIATAALLALGCHLCRTCQSGLCNWGIATQRPELVKRLDPESGSRRLINLMTAWNHEIKELMGCMGINSIEALRGNRLMLRGIDLTEKELEILGISHAGE